MQAAHCHRLQCGQDWNEMRCSMVVQIHQGRVCHSVDSLAPSCSRHPKVEPGVPLTFAQLACGRMIWALLCLALCVSCIGLQDFLARAPPIIWASMIDLPSRRLLDVAKFL